MFNFIQKLKMILICLFLTISANFTLMGSKKISVPAKICFVNIYEQTLDVRLGEEDNYVFLMEGLEPFLTTRLLNTTNYGNYILYFKLSSEKDWQFWGENDQPYYCEVEAGNNYSIVAGYDGTMSYYSMSENASEGAKVCFFNGTSEKIARMEVGKDWNEKTVAYIDNIPSDIISTFVTVTPGNYSLFWQFPSQVRIDEYYFYPTEDGQLEVFYLGKGKYYLFLAFTIGRDDRVEFYDITP